MAPERIDDAYSLTRSLPVGNLISPKNVLVFGKVVQYGW